MVAITAPHGILEYYQVFEVEAVDTRKTKTRPSALATRNRHGDLLWYGG